jgi:PLP dependent protein
MTETRMVQDPLSDRLTRIQNRIRLAAETSNRPSNDVRLIAISKTHPSSVIREALVNGATDFGENRVQEAEPKILEIGRSAARWHLVGHLQANKARRAVKLFDVIHSLDSIELAERLDRLSNEEGVSDLEVLIQIDLGHEETKTGVSEVELPKLVQVVRSCSHLKLVGLMTLPPFFDEVELVRPYFRRLRELRDELANEGAFGAGRGELSMGMTHDFEIAIQEGATMVRIGTAIFGERESNVR